MNGWNRASIAIIGVWLIIIAFREYKTYKARQTNVVRNPANGTLIEDRRKQPERRKNRDPRHPF